MDIHLKFWDVFKSGINQMFSFSCLFSYWCFISLRNFPLLFHPVPSDSTANRVYVAIFAHGPVHVLNQLHIYMNANPSTPVEWCVFGSKKTGKISIVFENLSRNSVFFSNRSEALILYREICYLSVYWGSYQWLIEVLRIYFKVNFCFLKDVCRGCDRFSNRNEDKTIINLGNSDPNTYRREYIRWEKLIFPTRFQPSCVDSGFLVFFFLLFNFPFLLLPDNLPKGNIPMIKGSMPRRFMETVQSLVVRGVGWVLRGSSLVEGSSFFKSLIDSLSLWQYSDNTLFVF